MDVKVRLQQLLDERGWSLYRLAQESGVSLSTLKNMFKRNTDPSISTLENLCRGMGIDMEEFFRFAKSEVPPDILACEERTDYETSGADEIRLSRDERVLVENYMQLTLHERELIQDLVDTMKKKGG